MITVLWSALGQIKTLLLFLLILRLLLLLFFDDFLFLVLHGGLETIGLHLLVVGLLLGRHF